MTTTVTTWGKKVVATARGTAKKDRGAKVWQMQPFLSNAYLLADEHSIDEPHSPTKEKLNLEKRTRVIVGIDFGTTYSGIDSPIKLHSNWLTGSQGLARCPPMTLPTRYKSSINDQARKIFRINSLQ